MSGYYCPECWEAGRKCPRFHDCLCGGPGLVWEDGWVECDKCARSRLIADKRKKENMCKSETCKTPSLENFFAGLCHMCFLALFAVSSKKQ